MPSSLPPIQLFDEVHSTNDLAMQAARDHDAPHGACFVADAQRGGRGRREPAGSRRSWFSPPGANLYLSLVVHNALPAERAMTHTLAAAVGLLDALLEQIGPEPLEELTIKWPNDLYLGSRKLAGVLCEGVLRGASLEAVVIGIGLNVNLKPEEMPEALGLSATSLLEHTGQLTDRFALALTIRRHLLAACERLERLGLEQTLERWRERDQTLGREVRAMIDGSWRQGTSRGISPTGGLLVEIEDGRRCDVQTGEVVFA